MTLNSTTPHSLHLLIETAQYCEITEDITEKELSKRIKAFGHGLETSKIFINSDEGKFEIDKGKTFTVNKKYKTIHRIKFSKS